MVFVGYDLVMEKHEKIRVKKTLLMTLNVNIFISKLNWVSCKLVVHSSVHGTCIKKRSR